MSSKDEKKFLRAFGGILLALSGGIFYGCFFKLAPWIVSVLPQTSEWFGVLKALTYIIIAYAGGIGLPLVLIFYGSFLLFFSIYW